MGRGLLTLLLLAANATIASAQATNTPEVGGQNNKEWGAAINDLAKQGRDSLHSWCRHGIAFPFDDRRQQ